MLGANHRRVRAVLTGSVGCELDASFLKSVMDYLVDILGFPCVYGTQSNSTCQPQSYDVNELSPWDHSRNRYPHVSSRARLYQ